MATLNVYCAGAAMAVMKQIAAKFENDTGHTIAAKFGAVGAMKAPVVAGEPADVVVLTAALPSILTGCRIGLVISCIVVFLSEMISSTDGLGQLMVRAARNFQTVDMFVPIITISLLGLVLNAAFNALRARILIGFPEET